MQILLPRFLTDGLFNVLLFNVGCLFVRLGALDASVRYDCRHLWSGEGFLCLGHDDCITAIAVGRPKIPLQLLHCPGELTRGSRSKIEDITF